MGKCVLIFMIVAFCHGCNKNDVQGYGDNTRVKMIGETISLSVSDFNTLYHPKFYNLKLYKKEGNRDILEFVEGIDYQIIDGAITLLPNSAIPDYSNHSVIYNSDDKFEWSPEPNRNPDHLMEIQIYADYEYDASLDYLVASDYHCSDNIQYKLNYKEDLNIAVVGTSISNAAHTYECYFHNNDSENYVHRLSNFFYKKYGVVSNITNLSADGGTTIMLNPDELLTYNLDLVIVEMGMNDHLSDNTECIFKDRIQQIITVCKFNNIEVCLIGFFQQNEDWILEDKENTILYNNILSELANTNDIYFADIYSAFEKLPKEKLYRDYTGDFMHHPSSFAHKLYYIELVPTFIKNDMYFSELMVLSE